MGAFRQAVSDWSVDMLEMDVRATRDGRVVVIHDASVDRTTDGSGTVAEMPWAELRELDAGYRFCDLRGRRSFAGIGVGVPLFQEVLEEFPGTRLNVEIKDVRAARGLVETIERHGAAHRVLIAAELERSRLDASGYRGPWGASRRQIWAFWLLHATPLSSFVPLRFDILQVPPVWRGLRVVTPRFVRAAQRRNVPVHVWTIDEEQEMRRLLAIGVDGIQSDRLDVLARVLVDTCGRPAPRALVRDPPGRGSAPPSSRDSKALGSLEEGLT